MNYDFKNAKELLVKTGSDITKTAKKAGQGFFTAAKSVKDTIDQTKAKVAAKAVYCYAISTENVEDTEQTMYAVSLLKKAGYDARIHVAGGTMFGYVFAKGEEFDKAAKLLEPVNGVALNEKPVDKLMAEMIKKHTS